MKKFGKVLIATVIVGGIAAAVAYFYSQKKKATITIDDDLDDEFEDEEERSYVSLNEGSEFTPLSETVKDVKEAVTETVEEFFDEDDNQ